MKVEVYLTGKEKLLEIANNILKLCDSDQAEVMVSASKGSLTRFANSYIHQNMSVVSANVTIRIIKGQKIGIAAVNSLEENAIKKAIKTATELADLQHDNPDFIGLPSKVQENYEKVESFVFETLECDPQYRTELVKKIVLEADKHQGLTVSGTVSTNTSELVLVNSLGVEAYRIEKPGEINREFINELIKKGKPILFDCIIDQDELAPYEGRIKQVKK